MLLKLRGTFLLCVLLVMTGCATFPSARPLEPGAHEVGVSLGGPVLNFNGAPLPIPNITLQGRHGLFKRWDRPFDLTYGLNLIALPFGLLQGHVGVSYLLIPQRGAAPALDVATKQFFATNAPSLPNKPHATAQGWTANQLDFYFSWEIQRQLIYTGITQYTDFGSPGLTLTPSLGVVLDTSPKTYGGLMFHFDFRWYALSQTNNYDAVTWIPEVAGAFGFGGGMSFVIPPGKKQAATSKPSAAEPRPKDESQGPAHQEQAPSPKETAPDDGSDEAAPGDEPAAADESTAVEEAGEEQTSQPAGETRPDDEGPETDDESAPAASEEAELPPEPSESTEESP